MRASPITYRPAPYRPALRNRFGQALARFAREQDGVAAVEFALIAPILIAALFGMTALGSYLRVASDLNAAADLVSDLASQQAKVTKDELDKFLIAAEAMSVDVKPGKMELRVDGIWMNQFGVPKITWSRGRNTAKLKKGDVVADLPASLKRPNAFIIRTHVVAEWTPVNSAIPANYKSGDGSNTDRRSGWDILESRDQTFTRYYAPRLGSDVNCEDCT